MNSRAQVGLEYLFTYGWALVIIATVIGVLVFVAMAPASTLVFSSSNPAKIIVKGGTVQGDEVEVKLQNITGGKMEITNISSTGFSNCTIDGSSQPITIGAGSQMTLECDASANQGKITIEYTDFAGLQRSVDITGSGTGATGASNGITAGLVGYWKANGNALDSSGTGNNGTWFGTEAYQAGVEGQAFDFPGNSTTGIAVADSSSLDLTTGITLAAWVNRRSYSGHYKVVIKPYDMLNTNPWELYALDYKGSSPGYPCFLISDGIPTTSGGIHAGACATSTFVPLNQWHHIASTYNGSIAKVYSDGQPVASEPASITIGTNNEAFYINGVSGQGFHIDGLTDDVRVYNGALSDIEICAVCNEFKPAGANCNC